MAGLEGRSVGVPQYSAPAAQYTPVSRASWNHNSTNAPAPTHPGWLRDQRMQQYRAQNNSQAKLDSRQREASLLRAAQAKNAGNILTQAEAARSTQQSNPLSSALAGNSPLTAQTGIQPQTPFTQADLSSADSAMRNMQTQLPPGMQHAGLAGLLGSATGALGSLAANQFGPQASAALAQYDLGSQKAQADALQGWMNLGQNQLGRDLRFNQQQQNWLYQLMGNAANAPEYQY